MSFSQFAGTAIMPLIARVVLVAAFLPAGYHKIFDTQEFKGSSAGILSELGVGEEVPVTAATGGAAVHLASFRQETPAGDAEPAVTPQEPEPADDDGSTETPADTAAETPTPTPTPPPPPPAPPATDADEPLVAPPPGETPPVTSVGPVTARSMHGITVMLVNAGWKHEWKPQYMAWVASLTEFLGGALILLGLFSRVWGLGLAIAMGFAFYLVSLPNFVDPGLFAMGAGRGAGGIFDGYATFNTMFSQLGLLTLGLGVFLAGPGPVSLDRILFRPRGAGGAVDDYDAPG